MTYQHNYFHFILENIDDQFWIAFVWKVTMLILRETYILLLYTAVKQQTKV